MMKQWDSNNFKNTSDEQMAEKIFPDGEMEEEVIRSGKNSMCRNMWQAA